MYSEASDGELARLIAASGEEAQQAEAALYRLLEERLKTCTIVSIGHRSTLAAFHRRRLVLAPDGSAHRVQEKALEAS